MPQDVADLWVTLSRDERHPWFGDTGLLPGDALEVVPQVVCVLQGDLGHRARKRRDDVGAVQPPTQPHLDHRDVHPARRQVGKGDRGGRLEEARLRPFDVRHEQAGPLGEGILGNRSSVHRHPFTHRHQMRGGIDPDTQPPALELRGDEGAGRSLAVGPADVDGWKVALRMVKCVEQCRGGSEAPFDAAGLSGEEKTAGVREGQPVQSAASAGRRPAM